MKASRKASTPCWSVTIKVRIEPSLTLPTVICSLKIGLVLPDLRTLRVALAVGVIVDGHVACRLLVGKARDGSGARGLAECAGHRVREDIDIDGVGSAGRRVDGAEIYYAIRGLSVGVNRRQDDNIVECCKSRRNQRVLERSSGLRWKC